MAKILGIGNATLDIINQVDGYPSEDSENRALSQRMALGGNAANTLHVLSQLNHRCCFMGVLAYDAFGHFVKDELSRLNISARHCYATRGRTPTSYITLNQQNGSRTIVHYRDLPELSARHFSREIDVQQYQWFHFQGRNNVTDIQQMMQFVEQTRSHGQRISLEIEKPHKNIEDLIPMADVLFFSKDYARHLGYDNAESFLKASRDWNPDALRICAWGRQGAWGENADSGLLHCEAFVPEKTVDTVGAGDTFNAGLIDAQCRGLGLQESLIHACRLAGRKVAQAGFEHLLNEALDA